MSTEHFFRYSILRQLASMKCLLSPGDQIGRGDHLVDLSRLAEQNDLMPLEHFEDAQNLEKEIEDSNYRRLMEEVSHTYA